MTMMRNNGEKHDAGRGQRALLQQQNTNNKTKQTKAGKHNTLKHRATIALTAGSGALRGLVVGELVVVDGNAPATAEDACPAAANWHAQRLPHRSQPHRQPRRPPPCPPAMVDQA